MAARSEFPPICVALGCTEAAQLEKLAREACEQGEQFLEIRLDLLEQPPQALVVIQRLQERYPETLLLATCRRQSNGGRFRGSVERQLELLQSAVEAGAGAVDVEIEAASVAQEQAELLRRQATLIVSYHNFESTPPLEPVLRRLRSVPADVHKLVTMARKPTDNLRVLEALAQSEGHSVVILAMGETGVPSRVLALSRGCPFTYVAPCFRTAGNHGSATAPGQLPAWQMRRYYRPERHTAETAVYGVIASPIGHSISPAVHNRAFQARRVDAVYLPFLVEAGQLRDFWALARGMPVAGFSVTIPHKQRVLRLLSAVDPPARRIGAVNTVYRRQGRLRGTNTDGDAVTGPLEKRLRLKGARVLIVGNGGAARAAAFSLIDKGARVTLAGRSLARVRALARLCGAEALPLEGVLGQRFDVLVHATPVGMHPNIGECLFCDEIPANLVFDMVYNPLETQLLKKARGAGKAIISGLEMFLEQASAQFEIWTGGRAPRMAMESAAREALECRGSGQ